VEGVGDAGEIEFPVPLPISVTPWVGCKLELAPIESTAASVEAKGAIYPAVPVGEWNRALVCSGFETTFSAGWICELV
jgi:hypothetical protein